MSFCHPPSLPVIIIKCEGRYFMTKKVINLFFYDKSSNKTDQLLVGIKRQNANFSCTPSCTSCLDYWSGH